METAHLPEFDEVEICALSGVLAFGFCDGGRRVTRSWTGMSESPDHIWKALHDIFRVLKLHSLPSEMCCWMFGERVLLGISQNGGVTGLLCEQSRMSELKTPLERLLKVGDNGLASVLKELPRLRVPS